MLTSLASIRVPLHEVSRVVEVGSYPRGGPYLGLSCHLHLDVRNSRYRFTRLVMVIAALVFFGVGCYSIAQPEVHLTQLGLVPSEHITWLITFMGVVLIALGIHQTTTSRYAADRAFRRAALLSVLTHLALAGVMYIAPGLQTTVRWSVVAVNGGFAFLYLATLPIKSIGYKEEMDS